MAAADGLRRAMRGLSEAAFRERFGTEAACREALFAMRWREGLTCPACGHRGFCALKMRKVLAVSTRSVTGARARLGRAGRGRQVLLEHLARGPVAEAAAGRVVEPVGEPPQGRRRERPGLGLARQEAADAAVRVLDGAFLPGAVRVAEVGLHRELPVEGGVAGELAAAVEGDRAAGLLGQRPEDVGDAGDHRRRALVLVREQEGEAALALDERGHVGLADLLPEDQQVRLPVPERLAPRDLGRPVLDPALARDRGAAGPAAVTGP